MRAPMIPLLVAMLFAGVLYAYIPTRANAAPTVVSKYISASANGLTNAYPGGTINNLAAASTREIHINGVVQDTDGQTDIQEVDVKFYRSGAGASCAASNNDCYIVDNCVLDTVGVESTQKRYDCTMQLQYYSDSTSSGGEFPSENWIVDVTVRDASSSGNDTALTIEMQTLLAVGIPSTISFGALSLGQNTTAETNQAQVMTQAGNDVADVELSASAGMACTTGVIPVANHKWSLTDVAYGSGAATALSGTPADTDLNIAYRHGANSTKSLFWNIGIPVEGVGGTCAGNITISAIAG